MLLIYLYVIKESISVFYFRRIGLLDFQFQATCPVLRSVKELSFSIICVTGYSSPVTILSNRFAAKNMKYYLDQFLVSFNVLYMIKNNCLLLINVVTWIMWEHFSVFDFLINTLFIYVGVFCSSLSLVSGVCVYLLVFYFRNVNVSFSVSCDIISQIT